MFNFLVRVLAVIKIVIAGLGMESSFHPYKSISHCGIISLVWSLATLQLLFIAVRSSRHCPEPDRAEASDFHYNWIGAALTLW